MYLASFEPVVIAYVLSLVVMIFIFVLLHELAHVGTARLYGVTTRAITLHPLGGVSMLERVPERPGQEALVGFAGPLVNLVFALVFLPIALHYHGFEGLLDPPDLLQPNTWILDLFWINVLLGVFNLLPAFPLDGGRILRSTLAIKLSYARATRIAAFIGRTLAIGFVVVGLFWNWVFVLIGIFVFFGAAMEERSAQLMRLFAKITVQDAMRTDVPTVHPHASLEEVVSRRENDDPLPVAVVEQGRLHGLIDRETLRFMQPLRDKSAHSVMRSNLPTITPEQDLSNALRQFAGGNQEAIPVVEKRDRNLDPERRSPPRFVGLITTQEMEAAYQRLRREALAQRAERAQRRRRRRGGLPQATTTRINRGDEPADAERWVPEGTKP